MTLPGLHYKTERGIYTILWVPVEDDGINGGLIPMLTDPRCKAKGCDKKVHGRGYCQRHYERFFGSHYRY